MKLYVCWTTSPRGHHPCGLAHQALVEAGHEPEVTRAYGWKLLPDFPFNMTPGRREAKRLTGSSDVPVLVTDDGDVVAGEQSIVEWAGANPADAVSGERETAAPG